MGEYEQGYREGYAAGFQEGWSQCGRGDSSTSSQKAYREYMQFAPNSKPKRKRRQSKKQKLLSDMAGKAWARYKKGNGKKTYIQIRAQVSRSAEYKRKAKKL
jgi:hypothetical protein